jgi:hypothetical protein
LSDHHVLGKNGGYCGHPFKLNINPRSYVLTDVTQSKIGIIVEEYFGNIAKWNADSSNAA